VNDRTLTVQDVDLVSSYHISQALSWHRFTLTFEIWR